MTAERPALGAIEQVEGGFVTTGTAGTTSQKRRGGRDNPGPGRIRHDVSKAARPTSATLYSVYAGTPFERAGAFRRDSASSFTAFDRRGGVIGVFESQSAAADAIEQEACK